MGWRLESPFVSDVKSLLHLYDNYKTLVLCDKLIASFVNKLDSRILKARLELKNNLDEILSVNCKFIRCFILPQLNLTKLKLEYLKFGF